MKRVIVNIEMFFSVKDYFDQQNAQSKTILKFWYNEELKWPIITYSRTKVTITQTNKQSFFIFQIQPIFQVPWKIKRDKTKFSGHKV